MPVSLLWVVLNIQSLHHNGKYRHASPTASGIEEKLLLSGDTLFKGSIGRTDLEGGDYDALMETLRGKLMSLAGDIEVLPGHGPRSTIAEEAQTNPFLLPFNEPFDLEELN